MSTYLWSSSKFFYNSSAPKLAFSSEIDGASETGSISVSSEDSENNKLFFKVDWTKTTTTYSGELQQGDTKTEIGNPTNDTSFKPTFNQNLGPMSLQYDIDTQSGAVFISCKINDFSVLPNLSCKSVNMFRQNLLPCKDLSF